MSANATAPRPAMFAHLSPRNRVGAVLVLECVLFGVLGLWLATGDRSVWLWLLGQTLIAVSLLQWFILLHEAGHDTLFRTSALNTCAGHLAGFLSGFPYSAWQLIHRGHHQWTGWQDRDATTASLAPCARGRGELALVNFCWKFWIPIFVIAYRIENYWNFWRIRRFLPDERARARVAINIGGLALAYAVLLLGVLDPMKVLSATWLAILISLIAQELILLSQHTHIPTNVSGGRDVETFAPVEQEPYTRSLRFPDWFSRFILFNFDRHELHHMYVRVPGWDLSNILYRTENDVDWFSWAVRSRRLSGERFFFQNRADTGFDL